VQSENRPDSQDLISGDRVSGTTVYDAAGERLGTIGDLMLSKTSGEVVYAVMKVGGFLEIGQRHHPLPWDALEYDPELGGYRLDSDPHVLAEAPHFAADEIADISWAQERVDSHYDTATRAGTLRRRRAGAFLPGAPTTPLGNVIDGGLSGQTGVAGAHRHGGATGSMGTGGMTGDGSGRI
jgi:hypothetical protein